MGEQKRQRSESVIKLLNQKKESKLWYEEANSHIKSGNWEKALHSYNKRICVTKSRDRKKMSETNRVTFKDPPVSPKAPKMVSETKSIAEKRLSITREAELLQSFVRVNVEDEEEEKDEGGEKEKKEVVTKEKTEKKIGDGEPKSKQFIPPETSRALAKELAQEPKRRLKRRKRKYGIKHEEIYCDKDRAAAVNLGSKDIKQSLKIKRKLDRSKNLQIPEEAEPGTFLALGNYEMCRGDLKIAEAFMSKAIELNPTEKNALVARSKCYILLGQPKKALEDAESALEIDKTFIKAVYQKAEALYFLGDFELALMYYHRGLHVRPDHEGFKLGVQKAQNAIETALGAFSASLRSKSTSGKSTARSNLTKEEDKLEGAASKSSHRSAATVSTRCKSSKNRLLKGLEADKEYLNKLLNNPDIKCKFKEDSSDIENCIKETVEYLNERQEFWRQQLPPN